MKPSKSFIISLVILLVVTTLGLIGYFKFFYNICPDKLIINEMPGSVGEMYFIKDGKRMEIFEKGEGWQNWVDYNCQIETMRVQ